MEDLRDVGQKALDSINDLGASDVGDLVLGIGNIIDELDGGESEEQQLKIDHLRGLFREFAHGEEYALREKPVEPKEEDAWKPYNSGPGGLSGVLPANFPITVSGMMSYTPIIVTGLPPHTGHAHLDDPYKLRQQQAEAIIKSFKPAWWKRQTKKKGIVSQLDD